MKFWKYTVSIFRIYSTAATNKPKIARKTSKKTPEIKWTNQQLEILAAVSDRKSIFISGSGGTGKTVLLQHITKRLKKVYAPKWVSATASTGIAACHIKGQTIHSFAGIKVGKDDKETLLKKVLKNQKAYERWKLVDALIIDECSMLSSELFDTLEFIARKLRSSDKPWGGIQLVVSGDFFQLPPIDLKKSGFAFEAKCWNSSFELQIELTEVFRQSDPRFIKLLQGVRRGKSDPEDLRLLKEHCTDAESDPSVIRMYPRNDDVERINLEHLQKLTGERITYEAVDDFYYEWTMPDYCVDLCVGARVLLNKNISTHRKLVNGATGTIIGFYRPKRKCIYDFIPRVKFDIGKEVDVYPEKWEEMDGEFIVSRRQIPLILAWAITIHKCQGMSLDRVHTDLSRAFDYGMVYVALSRAKSLEGLHLSGFNPYKIKAHPKVIKFYELLNRGASAS